MSPRAARTFPLALLEPACNHRERDWKLLAEVWLFMSSCPCLVLHDRSYRHPNDLLTPGTGNISLSPGMEKRAESEREAQKNKVTELGSELGTALHSALHAAAGTAVRP